MVYALIVVTVLVLMTTAFGLLRYRARARRLTRRTAPPPPPLAPRAQALKLKESGRYWGYRIESHCGASSRLSGREYRIDDSPPLPADGCAASPCTCCLIGLPNRRRQSERRSGRDRRRSLRLESVDRRDTYPRRATDLNSWNTYRHL